DGTLAIVKRPPLSPLMFKLDLPGSGALPRAPAARSARLARNLSSKDITSNHIRPANHQFAARPAVGQPHRHEAAVSGDEAQDRSRALVTRLSGWPHLAVASGLRIPDVVGKRRVRRIQGVGLRLGHPPPAPHG